MEHRTEQVLQSVDTIKEKWDNDKGWFCHFFFGELEPVHNVIIFRQLVRQNDRNNFPQPIEG